LKKRPERAKLEELNILKGADVAPSLTSAKEKLLRAQLEDQLDDQLKRRPTIEQMKQRRIIFNEEVEVSETFLASEYNRKPDEDVTYKNLTPKLKSLIREELNEFKRSEMSVHEESRDNTCFH